jgi:hypothetical protein
LEPLSERTSGKVKSKLLRVLLVLVLIYRILQPSLRKELPSAFPEKRKLKQDPALVNTRPMLPRT